VVAGPKTIIKASKMLYHVEFSLLYGPRAALIRVFGERLDNVIARNRIMLQ